MTKSEESSESHSDLFISLFKHAGVDEIEAKHLALQAMTSEPPQKRRKSDETKAYIKQIALSALNEGHTTLSVQRCKRDLIEKYGSIARPEFYLGKGPSGMRLLEIGKTKMDGRIFKITDAVKFSEWHAGKVKFLSPEYYGDEYFKFISEASVNKEFAFLKEYNTFLQSLPPKSPILPIASKLDTEGLIERLEAMKENQKPKSKSRVAEHTMQ